jgi:hypothetical protein
MLRSFGRSLSKENQNHDASSDKTQPTRSRRYRNPDLTIKLTKNHSDEQMNSIVPYRIPNDSEKIYPIGNSHERVENWTRLIEVGPSNGPRITINNIDPQGAVDPAIGPYLHDLDLEAGVPHTTININDQDLFPGKGYENIEQKMPVDNLDDGGALPENQLPSIEDKEPPLGLQLIEFLWDFIREGSLNRNISSNLLPEAVSILKDMISLNFKSERVDFIQKCIVSISNNQAVNESIEVRLKPQITHL